MNIGGEIHVSVWISHKKKRLPRWPSVVFPAYETPVIRTVATKYLTQSKPHMQSCRIPCVLECLGPSDKHHDSTAYLTRDT